MTAPESIILRESVSEGPTRRIVYRPLEAGGYEKCEQLWRLAIGDWHTVGTEHIESLAIDAEGVEASEYGRVGGSGALTIETDGE